jgi:iron complex outermembrane receptor protein
MEERSPGSYRFNIRGSSLRSPFGIRNVKVYYDDIPITDPGGNTYLNQLCYYNFNSIEVIKGPGSSLYGSGTGGVLLIESLSPSENPEVSLEYSRGSFASQNIYASITTGNDKYISKVGFQHQESEGYRQQSALKRNVHSWNGTFRVGNKNILKASFLYGDLFYETPGALTKSEYEADPKSARPGGGGFPGAVDAEASIRQKTFLAGASFDQQLLPWLRNKSVLYGMFTQLINPNLRAYESSSLPHLGGRTSFRVSKKIGLTSLDLDMGAEWQQGFNTVRVHKNVAGDADSLRSMDEINNRQSMIFMQGTLDCDDGWTVVAGASMNWYKLDFTRFSPGTAGRQKRRFDDEIAPRLAIMKKFNNNITLYSSISRGFSPPTTNELLPTGGNINVELNAEDGINNDIGLRASLKNRLAIDLNAFVFSLQHTIVQRRDAGGGDYFINAGKTNQKGIELSMSYPFSSNHSAFLNGLARLNYTYHHFQYRDFKQVSTDFSGNQLPGVSPHTIAAGVDMLVNQRFTASFDYLFSDRIPLNDANSTFADRYHLLSERISYAFPLIKKLISVIAIGAGNLLNEKYSLGNDINGFGGRYFNAASPRNYYATIRIQWSAKAK